jgi:hypothetical protein
MGGGGMMGRRGLLAALAAAVMVAAFGLGGCDTTLREQIELHVEWAKQIQAEGIVYVDGNDGDDANPGTEDLPKKTIQNAIDLAAALMDEGEVHVAQGTYHVYETVVVKEGISLCGGFEATVWARNIDLYTTVLRGISVDTVIKAGQGVTPTTVIEGFTIEAALRDKVYCVLCDHGSPIIRYNNIDASAGSVDSIGIRCRYSSPVINANTINAGNGSAASWGIWSLHANTRIWNNEIYGEGDHLKFEAIIINENSNVYIQNNTIRVGTPDGSGHGIYNADSTCIVENNIFFSTDSSNGCAICEGADTPLMEELNNNDFYQCDSCYQNLAEPQLDFSGMIGYLTGKLDGLDGNVNNDPEFEDQSGDPWDWSLSGNDTEHKVSRGGKILDTSFTNDRTGSDRTILNNWSMGAYEQDL